jgi:hypothetical protein
MHVIDAAVRSACVVFEAHGCFRLSVSWAGLNRTDEAAAFLE